MQEREHRKVSTFNGTYAFLTRDTGERDIFAHVSQLKYPPIHRGDKVSYVVAADMTKPGKYLAKDVRPVDGEQHD